MSLFQLYKRAKELFPFTHTTAPLVHFLTRRATIDEVEYKTEPVIAIRKARRLQSEEDEDLLIKKKSKKKIH
ncbi:hypothetical protein NEAUS03_0568 [Nematocida ausubeli]|nr:hypothetical protein NEAUS03_0568 [Nematocida ausubeli]